MVQIRDLGLSGPSQGAREYSAPMSISDSKKYGSEQSYCGKCH